jgi:hypothetical protein
MIVLSILGRLEKLEYQSSMLNIWMHPPLLPAFCPVSLFLNKEGFHPFSNNFSLNKEKA